jgi:hypothetical protein
MRLFALMAATALLAFGALKLSIEGNDDVCSGKDTLRCSDGVVAVAGVALWVLLAALLVLTAIAAVRLRRWVVEQRRFR